ncbi:hypothetical protein [Sorangium sp. So ce1099]|uniref:hypothetical protein n=1 Tax=Sorangium sp. So ce1099 TaxID=3133331 RepID=UPI003F61C8A9
MTKERHILIVVYDIKSGAPERYSRVIQELKKSRAWWNHIKPAWILISEEDAAACSERLSAHLSRDDKLLVLEVDPVAAQGLLNERAWAWLNRQLGI